MRVNGIFMAACAALALTACKKDISEISDEQLLSLLGSSGNPAQITANTRECVEMLSGINETVYKDVPEDFMGMFKTECRKQLQVWLDDPDRNRTELDLDDFERTDLAERIVALDKAQVVKAEALRKAEEAAWATQRAAEEAERAARRAAEEAERTAQREAEAAAKIEALETKLALVTGQGQKLRTEFEARKRLIVSSCGILNGLEEDLKTRNHRHKLLYRGLPSVCTTEEAFRLQASWLTRFEEKLASFKLPEQGDNMFVSVPSLPDIDMEYIDKQIEKVEAVTMDYRAALAEE